jgi:ATP-binding cassette subfamily F protein 3
MTYDKMLLVGERMIVIQAHDLSISFAGNDILKNINLAIKEKEKVGLIGANGSGKTTLLKCLRGELLPDRGEVSRAKLLSVAYMEQLNYEEAGITAWDAVMDAFSSLLEQRKRLFAMEKEMSRSDSGADTNLMERYAGLREEYERANGDACESMARRILIGLGFSETQFLQPLQTFSGGQKTRLKLGKLLALSPDFLLLDEPTNHLDMAASEWLEEFLRDYKGTVLLVSHDRMFLDKFASRILELKNAGIKSYPGNYSNYLRIKARDELSEERAYEKQAEHIKDMEDYIRKYKAGIKSKQARGRQSQLNRLERIDRPVRENRVGSLNIQMKHESGQDVLRISSLDKSFGSLELFQELSLSVYKGDKIALLGPNGCGKTTLLKIISGLEKADAGEIILGSRVKIGYFSQEYEELDYSKNLLEELIFNFDIDIGEARGFLGRMLFRGDDVFKTIADLSGGEKGRLCLLKLVLSEANFLILDEPTNHLDIESRQAVEEMLKEYPGTILFVSHDRYFIDRIAERIAVIDNKSLKYFWGNYSHCQDKIKAQGSSLDKNSSGKYREKGSRQEQFRYLQKEKEKLARRLGRQLEAKETEIDRVEKRKKELELLLSDTDLFNDMRRGRELAWEYDEVQKKLLAAYDDWEKIALELEE